MPPTTEIDFVQPELEAGRDAEVASAAADRPEEVRMRFRIHMQELAICSDDFSGQQICRW